MSNTPQTPPDREADTTAAKAEAAKADLRSAGEKTANAVQEAKRTAAAAAEDARHEGERLVKDLASASKYAARDAAESAVETAQSLTDRKTSEAATQVMHFSGALHQAADKLRGEDHTQAAGYVGTAARALDRTAEYLDRADLKGLLDDAARFAHRRPEIFIGGMVVAGLGLARFLKASSPRRDYADVDAHGRPDLHRTRSAVPRYRPPSGSGIAPRRLDDYSGQSRGEQYQAAVARPLNSGGVAVTRIDEEGRDDVLVASPASDVPSGQGVA